MTDTDTDTDTGTGSKTASTVITSTGQAWQDTPDRVEVFRIIEPGPVNDDGTPGEPITKVYDMPRKPHVGVALQYLKRARREGAELALSWLMEVALGADAYDDLSDQPDFTTDDLKTITKTIQKIAMGGLEGPKVS